MEADSYSVENLNLEDEKLTREDSLSTDDQEDMKKETWVLLESDGYSVEDLNLQAKTPSRDDSLSTVDQEDMKKRTYDLLESGEIEIKLHEQFKNAILILGDTGNGKSKFTQWIAGDNTKLISVETEEDTDEFIIEEEDNGMYKSIITSETIFPQLVVDAETNDAIYDCPGFNDTRDASNEIAATYFIKKVVDHAERVKLIFVINHPSVRKGVDRHNFMKLVKHVADFVKDIEKFKNSVALVVTKVDNQRGKQGNLVDNNKIIAAIANFLIEVKKDLEVMLQNGSSRERQLHEAAVKIISILLIRDEEHFARIGIFRRPDEPGPLNEISLLQEEKKHIKRLIREKIVFSEKKNDDFGYTISDKCKNKIHYLVEDINRTIKFCLCGIMEKIKEHYTPMFKVILNTVKSFVDETTDNVDFQEVTELSVRLRDGCHTISGLIGDVKNPKDLAPKLNALVSNLKINVPQDYLLEIENKAKYFNCLQVVNDKPLNIVQWDELFRDVEKFLSNAKENIQEEIDVVAPVICKQMECDFQQIAKALQNQLDEKTKSLDTKEALHKLNNYHNAISEMAVNIKKATSAKELLKIVGDAALNLSIDLPENKKITALQKEQKLIIMKSVGKTEFYFEPSAWTLPFENLVTYLNESVLWCKFLEDLYAKFSEYEIQKNRDSYNVCNIEDWGTTGKPQGLVLTESNFSKFLSNIADFNIAMYDDVKNITITELRLNQLNQLLNLTLKHQLDIQFTSSAIIISADYISIKDFLAYLEHTKRSLFQALKSGEHKFLYIFALRKVFIDEDLSLPGVELSIISPKWEVIGTRKINLDGFHGKPYVDAKAPDAFRDGGDGEDGIPGLPGKPGGNFFGIGKSFLNGSNLTVTVNGGNGGPGQHGGNGRQGRIGEGIDCISDKDIPITGRDGTTRVKGFLCETVSKWSSFSLFIAFLRVFGFKGEENTYFKIHGKPGQAGGNGGHGGTGGEGGNPGNVVIHDLSEDSEETIIAEKNEGSCGGDGNGGKGGAGESEKTIIAEKNEGSCGEDGNGGKGGAGGLNGNDTWAIYNGLFFPEWIDKTDKPAGYASNGENGSSGLNSRRLKQPELPNVMPEPLKIINEYEGNAKQCLVSPFDKTLILGFIDRLKDMSGKKDDEIYDSETQKNCSLSSFSD